MLRDFGGAKRPKNRVLRVFLKEKNDFGSMVFGGRVLVFGQGFWFWGKGFSEKHFGSRVFWFKGFKML